MHRTIFVFIWLMCAPTTLIFAEGVSVHLSQRKVGLNDSFSITFAMPQQIKTTPDFSPLYADFDIVSNSHDKSISIINGQMSQETRWNLVLIPKREGNLIIPSIQFGEHTSSPQAIEVSSSIAAKQDDAIFLETELSPKDSVYEQSLLTYTVRLFCSVKMAQAALSDINLNDKDALVERLENDVEYDCYHNNGKHYRVYERKYFVFPQHPGELVFSPLVFEGAIITGGNFFFDMQTKIKRVHSDKQTINVKPIPAPFKKNNWLAANDVILTQEWSGNPDTAALGEPLTWTLKLSANGCLGNQIPDIAIDFPGDLKHYFDKADVSNQITAESLIGTKQIKVALIPTKAGKIELPKVTIPWWDLKTEQVRYAELPSQILNVQDVHIAMNAPPSLKNASENAPTLTEESKDQNKETPYLWAGYVLGLVVLILGLIIVAYKLGKSKANSSDSLKDLKRDLKKACHEENAKQAETALLAWFSQAFPETESLNLLSIKHPLSDDLHTAMRELYQALYSKNNKWDGEALWKAFNKQKFPKARHRKTKKKKDLLPELY